MKNPGAIGCLFTLLGCPFAVWAQPVPAQPPADALRDLRAGWENPARTYKPHTRWWWPGNALNKADITWQLEQMRAQGIGGVEIMSAWRMYEKGSVDYLSPAYFELVHHTIAEAKRLDMDVAFTFGSGWAFGGSWVKPEDQSKVLGYASVEVAGGNHFNGPLPRLKLQPDVRNVQAPLHPIDPGQLIAVVAGRVGDRDSLDPESLVVLTGQVQADGVSLAWTAPPGNWRLMVFWLTHTWQINFAQSFEPPPMVIDHLSEGAVSRYVNHLGGLLSDAVGSDFGSTVDSLFCDSFEIAAPPQTLLWSSDTLGLFQQQMGYDLTKFLPGLWFDFGPSTPRVRYDVGKFLSDLALKNFFKTFNDWCSAHHTQARVQPHYRFTEELVQGSGAIARPETEVTTARFEPLADPRKATASAAHFYGDAIVSAEAYTFLHLTRYRTNLQELKIATDSFLRDGVTQFYNAGYFGSPEAHVAPTRDLPWDSNDINHWSPWWKYYHYLGSYVARSCYLLRQGKLVADVLIYTPQATEWSGRAIWSDDKRVIPYGDLAKTLVANGYDFDIVNDDLLQNHAKFRSGGLEINGNLRRILLLPRTTVVPIETIRAIRRFADAGGQVVALDQLPSASAGLRDCEQNDRELKQIVSELFHPSASAGRQAEFLPDYLIGPASFYPGPAPYRATAPLNAVRRELLAIVARVAPPDFALEGNIQSDGLAYVHRRIGNIDIYFVTNLEPSDVSIDVKFRCAGKRVQRWDPMTGAIVSVKSKPDSGGTTIPLNFHAWESAFFVFSPESKEPEGKEPAAAQWRVREVVPVKGPWRMSLSGYGFDSLTLDVAALTSWTARERTRHFSGTGRYEVAFSWDENTALHRNRVMLDLGEVRDVAEVELNGKPVGVAWMTPYLLDITPFMKGGSNRLVVDVTNTLINYVSGLKAPPEVPIDLQPRLGRENLAVYPGDKLAPFLNSSLTFEMSEKDLPPSGLLGPVRIVTYTPP